MTDSDIVKALEYCTNCVCNNDKDECPLLKMSFCKNYLMKQSLDLINRQKAEIERLKRKLVGYEPSIDSGLFSQMLLEQKEKAEAFEKKWKAEVKSEAYREFAERLRKKSRLKTVGHGEVASMLDEYEIDNLLKELVGEDDG